MAAPEQLSTVLITGGTDGLGRAAALLLAAQGYRVFAAGRSSEKRATLDQLGHERGLPLETVEMDVWTTPQWRGRSPKCTRRLARWTCW